MTLQQGFYFQLSNRDRQNAAIPWGPANPQALNRYSYVQNNPLRYTDPMGHTLYLSPLESAMMEAGIRATVQYLREGVTDLNRLRDNIMQAMISVLGVSAAMFMAALASGQPITGVPMTTIAVASGIVGGLMGIAAQLAGTDAWIIGLWADQLSALADAIHNNTDPVTGLIISHDGGSIYFNNPSSMKGQSLGVISPAIGMWANAQHYMGVSWGACDSSGSTAHTKTGMYYAGDVNNGSLQYCHGEDGPSW